MSTASDLMCACVCFAKQNATRTRSYVRIITTSVSLRHNMRCVPMDGTRDCVSAARKFVTSTSVAAEHCRRNAVSLLFVLGSGHSSINVSRLYFNCLTTGIKCPSVTRVCFGVGVMFQCSHLYCITRGGKTTAIECILSRKNTQDLVFDRNFPQTVLGSSQRCSDLLD